MSVRQIDVRELSRLLQAPPAERPLLLDVRNPDEYERVHLADATLIPLPELQERLGEVPTGRQVVVYCHHGIRSLSGAALLEGAGHRAVSLRGGIDAWSLLIDPALPRY